MTEIPQRAASALDAANEALQQFSTLIEKKPEKISDSEIEMLVAILQKNCGELNVEAQRDWSATPLKDVDEEIANRIIDAITFIRGNAQATVRFANMGNVMLKFWKTLRRTHTDIKKFSKRIKIEKIDDIGFGPGKNQK